MTSEKLLAWHFVGSTLRDGRPVPPDGEWLVHDGPCVICESGLHASYLILDALNYAPGATCCRVEIDAIEVEEDDKIVCQRRQIIWRVDASDVLREFARWCASEVIDLWDATDAVREFVQSGNPDLRSAAESAARSAAESAVRSAAEVTVFSAFSFAAFSAAESAASSAAISAARSAAFSAAEAAARSAAWSAAESAACSAAFSAASSAAWSAAFSASDAAARSAAEAAASSAAFSAAKDKQNEKLTEMIIASHDQISMTNERRVR